MPLLVFMLFISVVLVFVLGLCCSNLWLGFFFENSFSLCVNNFSQVCGSISSVELMCILMLAFCGGMSLVFSKHYFGWEHNNLNILILLFLGVMVSLIITNDYFSTLMFWEYLGFVSFLLILYYANYDTCYAGNVTLLSSRFGDVGLFLVYCMCLMGTEFGGIFLLSVGAVILTKSAVIPFSSWLLEAMRAPTPVSCLVHSSTLVAAGVWFLMNYGSGFYGICLDWLLLLSLFTIMCSAHCSLYFSDVKKIVALSTCNNIAWCLVYYLLGYKLLCAMQLVSHGIGKCLLFMGVGDILAGSYSSQNYYSLFGVHANSNFNWLCVSLLILLISGVPFNGVFFTKHLLLGGFLFNGNGVIMLMALYCVYLSYLYSGRLLALVSVCLWGTSNWINTVFFVVGYFLLFSNVVNYWGSCWLDELNYLSSLVSGFVVLFQVIGFTRGYLFSYYTHEVGWYSLFAGQDVIVKLFSRASLASVGLFLSLSQYRLEVWLLGKFTSSSVYQYGGYGGPLVITGILLLSGLQFL